MLSAIEQLESDNYSVAAASIRLALESVSSFEKSVRIINSELATLKKEKKKTNYNVNKNIIINKSLAIVQNELSLTTSKMQVN